MTTPDQIFKARIEKEVKMKNLISSIYSYLERVDCKLRKYERNEKFGAW